MTGSHRRPAKTAVDRCEAPDECQNVQVFEDKMARLTAELRDQSKQSAKLDGLIWANLEDFGYGG